jgi:hypothetical protein
LGRLEARTEYDLAKGGVGTLGCEEERKRDVVSALLAADSSHQSKRMFPNGQFAMVLTKAVARSMGMRPNTRVYSKGHE